MNRFSPRVIVIATITLLIAMGLFWMRPIGLIHGTVMIFYKNPLIWKGPLIAAVLVFVAASIPHIIKTLRESRSSKSSSAKPADTSSYSDDYYSRRTEPRSDHKLKWMPVVSSGSYGNWRLSNASIWALSSAALVFVLAIVVQVPLNSRATYEHYSFAPIDELPETSSARIMPYEVAEQISSSGFDSSTERLSQLHLVVDSEGRMNWTSGQVPNGFFRRWTKSTKGIVSQPADITSRDLTITDEKMVVSPDVSLTDNVRWKAYKENFFSDIAATTFMLDDQGRPVIISPYIEYEGFWTKVPVLGGVYLIRGDGSIEDLSPEEAAKQSFLAASGQLFPATLARKVQESYKYKGGIFNRFFTHEDQTELSDNEYSNQQPYLTSFQGMAPQWVSSAEPYGRSYATKAVFMTDSVTGRTRVWSPEDNSSLSGPEKALDVVKGLAIPGILFSKFRAIEPRPIVHQGRLQFVISVVPNTMNTVTKTVVVDAASNKAVATFNHDTDPGADRSLRQYIAGRDGDYTSAEIIETGDPDNPGTTSVPDDLSGQRKLIQRLIKSNAEQRALLDQLQQQLSSP